MAKGRRTFTVIRLVNPEWLILLGVIPLLFFRYVRQQRSKRGSIRFSDLSAARKIVPSLMLRLRHSLILLRCLAIFCLVVGLARPQSGREGREILSQGIDIILALDASSSMEAQDLGESSRLEVSKQVVAEFADGRINDRLGLVVFAGEAYTQCPLTLDYGVFLAFLKDVQIAGEDWDGTAIGTAIATAVNRLRDSNATSKVVILLTDGLNNRGEIDPMTAAKAAEAVGVRIYTIGAGSEGEILRRVDGGLFGPRQVRVKVEIDEDTLRDVAETTGGQYFRATSIEKLEAIYAEIGEMEKTEIKTREYVNYRELFPAFLLPGLLLLGLESLLANTRFRRIP
jgi:Ca-activated chloride channel family protein